MDHIRNILPQANASRGEGVEFSAAAVVSAVNDVLRRQGFSETQAQATSVQHGRARIRVSHGAVAGMLRQREEGITEDVNTLLRQRFPRQADALVSFTTRQT